MGARAVWLQLGVFDDAATERARQAGLDVVVDRCPKIEHPRLSVAEPDRLARAAMMNGVPKISPTLSPLQAVGGRIDRCRRRHGADAPVQRQPQQGGSDAAAARPGGRCGGARRSPPGRRGVARGTFAFAIGFLPPIGSPRVKLDDDIVVLCLFVVVAGAVGIVMATIVRRPEAAGRGRCGWHPVAPSSTDQRRTLLRSVSHDLRTPLATIRAVATDLDVGTTPDPTRDELLDLVVDEVERLDRLVDNLLSLSRIEAGAFLPDRQAVDLAELVEACVRALRRVSTG